MTQLVYATVSKDSTDTTGRMYVLDPYGSSTQLLRADTQFEAELTTGRPRQKPPSTCVLPGWQKPAGFPLTRPVRNVLLEKVDLIL